MCRGPPDNVRDRARLRQVDARSASDPVKLIVGEPGNDRAAVELDDTRVGAHVDADVCRRSHCYDALAPNGDALDDPGVGQRDDRATEEDEVGGVGATG